MIEILRKEIDKFHSREEKINHLREFLQILILKIIYDTGFMANLVFTGGTALRILFDLRRFSEDLDFSLVHRKNYDFVDFSRTLKDRLSQYGLLVETKKKTEKYVQKVDVRFIEILFKLSLSSMHSENLLIRIEIDTNPPAGGRTEISTVNKTFIFQVVHFDIPSLFATKIHACFYRKYTKGRDFYDLLWYLTKKAEPNFRLLNNAIRQTQGDKVPAVSKDNLGTFLRDKLKKVDFKTVRKDVERFLEDKNEVALLNRETFLDLVKR
jgi:predicted nucleotidyltransferase component of viral defense system